MTSIIIPAYNESAVIERCLQSLLDGAEPDEYQIIVACNGCHDNTAELARAFDVTVLETEVGSKTVALNMGDEAATSFPRIYLDADIMLRPQDIRAVVKKLNAGPELLAAPQGRMSTEGASWAVRAYYDIWTSLPYFKEGLMGVGVYALSQKGRERFEEFPKVIADDGYVRALYRAHERCAIAEATSVVQAPSTLKDLLNIKIRSRLGGYELWQRYPEIMSAESSEKPYGQTLKQLLLKPWCWPKLAVYLYVVMQSKRQAKNQLASLDNYTWARDESTR